MIYRSILKKAWFLNLKNRWLWFLGFFAAFLGSASVYEFIMRSYSNLTAGRSVFYTLLEYLRFGILNPETWRNLSKLWQTSLSSFSINLFVVLLFVVVFVVFIILAVISQAGLTYGIIKLDQEKRVSLKTAWQHGQSKFWQVLVLNIITKVILLGFLTLIAFLISLLVVNANWFNFLIFVLAFVLIIAISFIIYFLTLYGTAFIVLKNKDFKTALKMSWQVFLKNILVNIEMGLILFIVKFIVGLFFLVAAFIVLSPLFLLYMLMFLLAKKVAIVFFTVLLLVVLGFGVVLLGSWLSSFQISVWMLLFEELYLDKVHSKVKRIHYRVREKRRK